MTNQEEVHSAIEWIEGLRDRWNDKDNVKYCNMAIKALEQTEPERKPGKWIWEDGNIPYCSNCKKYSDDADMQDIHGEVLYCSHCGAKMEVET